MKLLTGIAASLLLSLSTLAATKKNVEALRIQTFQNTVVEGYSDNLKKSLDNQMNSLSLKVLYYIDFNALKNRLKG